MTPSDILRDPHWRSLRGRSPADYGITTAQIKAVADQYTDTYGPLKNVHSHAENYLIRIALCCGARDTDSGCCPH